MIVFLKGESGAGKSTLARRLARHLELAPPPWPVTPDMLAQWRRGLRGVDLETHWTAPDDDYFREGHVNLDRARALCQFLQREALPPLPDGDDPADHREWMETCSREVTSGSLLKEFFDLTCRLVDPAGAIVEGTLLGKGEADFRFLSMLEFRFSSTPKIKLLVTCDGEGRRRVRAAHGDLDRDLDPDAVVAAFHRDGDGAVAVAPPLAGAVYHNPWKPGP